MNRFTQIRPQVLTVSLILGGISIIAMFHGFDQVAVGAVGGLIAALTKLSDKDI
jgi:hypothetical protein